MSNFPHESRSFDRLPLLLGAVHENPEFGTNYVGCELNEGKITTPFWMECARICHSDPNCQAWSWAHRKSSVSPKHCYTKKKECDIKKVRSLDFISGSNDTLGLAQPLVQPDYSKKYGGCDIKDGQTTSQTWKGCKKLCQARNECKFWVFRLPESLRDVKSPNCVFQSDQCIISPQVNHISGDILDAEEIGTDANEPQYGVLYQDCVPPIKVKQEVKTWMACASMCKANAACKFWTYGPTLSEGIKKGPKADAASNTTNNLTDTIEEHKCQLLSDRCRVTLEQNAISGKKTDRAPPKLWQPQYGAGFTGCDLKLNDKLKADTWMDCGKMCKKEAKCKTWTWSSVDSLTYPKSCSLKTGECELYASPDVISGDKLTPGPSGSRPKKVGTAEVGKLKLIFFNDTQQYFQMS